LPCLRASRQSGAAALLSGCRTSESTRAIDAGPRGLLTVTTREQYPACLDTLWDYISSYFPFHSSCDEFDAKGWMIGTTPCMNMLDGYGSDIFAVQTCTQFDVGPRGSDDAIDAASFSRIPRSDIQRIFRTWAAAPNAAAGGQQREQSIIALSINRSSGIVLRHLFPP